MNSDMPQTFALIIQFSVVLAPSPQTVSMARLSLIAIERLHYHVGMYCGFYLISSFERPSQQLLEKIPLAKSLEKMLINELNASIILGLTLFMEAWRRIRKIWETTSGVKSINEDFKSTRAYDPFPREFYARFASKQLLCN